VFDATKRDFHNLSPNWSLAKGGRCQNHCAPKPDHHGKSKYGKEK
jgi:hypothetical protein